MQLASRQPKPPVESRRAERELFFWTVRQALKLVSLSALVIYSLVAMVEGHIPGLELLLRSL